jgi:preprotein translocase subunit YajC
MNWYIIIPVCIALMAGIVFIIIRNNKDKKQLENKLNNELPVSKAEDADRDSEETMK